jgi:tellurite resistance protein TerC
VVTKFHLLKYGLAVILTFVGAKMLLEKWIHVPIMLSLGVVLGVLALSIAASLIWPQAKPDSEGKTGSMFGR